MNYRTGIPIILVASAASAAVLLGVGMAHADNNDTMFLQTLNDGGIHGDSAMAIKLAHSICEAFAAGNTPALVEETLVANVSSSRFQLSYAQAEFLAGLSVRAYCPGYTPNLH
jgi:Protein of unknown function (DUF732)